MRLDDYRNGRLGIEVHIRIEPGRVDVDPQYYAARLWSQWRGGEFDKAGPVVCARQVENAVSDVLGAWVPDLQLVDHQERHVENTMLVDVRQVTERAEWWGNEQRRGRLYVQVPSFGRLVRFCDVRRLLPYPMDIGTSVERAYGAADGELDARGLFLGWRSPEGV